MLNEFISKVKSTGLAKTNRYRVTIATPIIMTSLMNSGRLITLFCESTSLPGQVIATTEHNVMGEHREFPYMKKYDNITLSFYIDNNFEVKGFFDNWLNSVSNTQNKITSYYKDYIAPTVLIEVLPMDSEVSTYSITLHEAYPKGISPIQLSADSRDIAKIGVSLNYKYYTTSHVASTKSMSSIGGTLSNQPMNITSDAIQDLQSSITASGFKETLLDVKNPDTKKFINELLGR
jgi:hypothetical protein